MLDTLYKSHSVEYQYWADKTDIIFIQQKINREILPDYCPENYTEGNKDPNMDEWGGLKYRIEPSNKVIKEYFKDKDPVIYVHTRIYSRGRSERCCVS